MIISAIPVFALTGQTLELQNLGTNGIIARTGVGTLAARTLTGTDNQVAVTNGDGVSGNPTFSLPQNIDTLANVEFASIATESIGTNEIIIFSTEGSPSVKILSSEDDNLIEFGQLAEPSNISKWSIGHAASDDSFRIGTSDITTHLKMLLDANANLMLGGVTAAGTSATKTGVIGTGTAPSSSPADAFQFYSADFAAGQACPHFRTENGVVVKLNQNVGTDGTPSYPAINLRYSSTKGGQLFVNAYGSTYFDANISGQSTVIDSSLPQWRMFASQQIDALGIQRGAAAETFSAVLMLAVDANGNLGIGTNTHGTSAARVCTLLTGTAPSTSPADAMQIYSADQAAGNACFHTRTENNKVIKLYQQPHIADATDAATVITRCNALLAALENLGLLATS